MPTIAKPDMPILRETADQIYQRIVNRLTALAETRGDTPPAAEEGEFFYDLLYPLAEEISEQQQLLEYAFLQGFLPWADGEFLDSHGYLLGLTRVLGEEDEAYRNRLIARARTEEGNGRRTDYESWALEIPGVGGAVGIEHERNDVSIDLYLTDPNGQSVTEDFARSVQKKLWETRRIAGHDLACHPAPIYPITVEVTLSLTDETKREAIVDMIDKRIKEYLSGRTSIVYQQIGALFFVDGVTDFTSFKLNGGTANLIKPLKAVSVLTLVVE